MALAVLVAQIIYSFGIELHIFKVSCRSLCSVFVTDLAAENERSSVLMDTVLISQCWFSYC